MLDHLRQATDDLDIGLMIYNAGAAHRTGTFLEGALDDALRTVQVNVVGQLTLSHHFGSKMAARGRGGILLIGSSASIAGSPGIITYCGAKAFSQIFAEGLWVELKPQGVDVLQVPLGAVNTPSMRRIGIEYGPEFNPADPDRQAQEILANLTDGPVYVPPVIEDHFYAVRGMRRREAAELMTKRLSGVTGAPGHS